MITLEEILAALPCLPYVELKIVSERAEDLVDAEFRRRADEELKNWQPAERKRSELGDWVGSCNFPEDFAVNHDHYLYGTPKKW